MVNRFSFRIFSSDLHIFLFFCVDCKLCQVCNAGVQPEASEREREVSGRICEAKAARVFWPGDNFKVKVETLKGQYRWIYGWQQVDESENIAELGARLKSAKESFVSLLLDVQRKTTMIFDNY